MDQMLIDNVEKFEPIASQFKFYKHAKYSTHNLGGILDLVFDNRISEDGSWIPSPYSDHFQFLYNFMQNM